MLNGESSRLLCYQKTIEDDFFVIFAVNREDIFCSLRINVVYSLTCLYLCTFSRAMPDESTKKICKSKRRPNYFATRCREVSRSIMPYCASPIHTSPMPNK